MKTRRHSLQKSCDPLRQQEDMNTQTPKAAGSSVSFRSADHGYSTLPTSTVDVDSNREPTASWPRPLNRPEGPPHDEKLRMEHSTRSYTNEGAVASDFYPPVPVPIRHPNIPEELAKLIVSMIPGPEGEELAEAYREGNDLPPVTKQSLSELDIQNVITNIKLRHDVNFDRDLSFRPNLDGAKGHEKMKAAHRYWKALVAELELYARLFRGSPSLRELEGANWTKITQHAERRIPIMFQTIQEILRSLVPDRDHSRVEEHLDVSMLMQEIERGVCDMVRLAEWMGHLLKEHCAPMRDGWVDKMVAYTRLGATTNNSNEVVKGLCELLGILEAMKLDVANHQIRNLKPLLIEDTVNFEKHYHLDRLVNRRAKIDIDTAHTWYSLAVDNFQQQQRTNEHGDSQHLPLEIFVRGVTATLFGRHGQYDFPETFYLDHDRLSLLRAEIDDIVFFDVCLDMFAHLVKRFGYEGPVSLATQQQLRISLSAIIGETGGFGSQPWVVNSEALSLEILRQASLFTGRPAIHDFNSLLSADQHLRHLFHTSTASHAGNLEARLLPHIFACLNRHANSSPTDLFNALVPATSTQALPSAQTVPVVASTDTFTCLLPQHQNNDKLTDIINRITHIVLLHWRTWKDIAYIQEEDSSQPIMASTTKDDSGTCAPSLTTRSPAHPG